MRWNYKKVRLLIAWATVGIAFGGVAWLLYREWATPITPHPTTITTRAPAATITPPAQAKATYSVPPAYPRWLTIGKIGVSAAIQAVGVTKDDAVDAPKTAWEVGWYSSSGLPGEQAAMLIDGHVNDSFNTPGVFSQLHTLTSGDTLEVERGDGQTFSYRVVKVEQQPLEKIDMVQLLRSITPNKPGLNLVTCGGIYDRRHQTYTDRVMVFSEQILP